jgi:hypothetical protein
MWCINTEQHLSPTLRLVRAQPADCTAAQNIRYVLRRFSSKSPRHATISPSSWPWEFLIAGMYGFPFLDLTFTLHAILPAFA